MSLDFQKNADGLLPAIIQDASSGTVLMLGYMNEIAFAQTKESGKVVFYSRSRQSLWQKGETSGNFLHVREVMTDCDRDTILIKASPAGPVCHTGMTTCFGEQTSSIGFLNELEDTISDRRENPIISSYTSQLFESGINKIAQKVGEEAVELVIESTGNDIDAFKNEAADLIFHTLVLLAEKGVNLADVVDVLQQRKR